MTNEVRQRSKRPVPFTLTAIKQEQAMERIKAHKPNNATIKWKLAHEARLKREAERMTTKLLREQNAEAYRQEQAYLKMIDKARREAERENYRFDMRKQSHHALHRAELEEDIAAHGGDK